MNKNKLMLSTVLTYFALLMQGTYAAEEKRIEETKQLGNDQLASLPKEIFNEIISFLPNTEAETVQEYFKDLNSLRLVSKNSKEAVDNFVTKFLADNKVVVQPNQTNYQAFKEYIASAPARRAQKEEAEIIAATGQTSNVFKNIINAINTSKSSWLSYNKNKIDTEFKNKPYLQENSEMNKALVDAVLRNDLPTIKALQPFIKNGTLKPEYMMGTSVTNEMWYKNNWLPYPPAFVNSVKASKAVIENLEQKLKQNPNDTYSQKELKKAKNILTILENVPTFKIKIKK